MWIGGFQLLQRSDRRECLLYLGMDEVCMYISSHIGSREDGNAKEFICHCLEIGHVISQQSRRIRPSGLKGHSSILHVKYFSS